MVLESKWFAKVAEKLDGFCILVEEKIDKEQRQLKASLKKTEIETKLAQEIKLHNELSDRLAEISRRSTELDRICSSFAGVTIAESDQNRLDNAKENFEIAKEMTGIRFDFAAPPNIAKGFIKNESRKLLLPFEIDMSLEGNSDALWTLLQTTAAPGWPFMAENKENVCNN